MKIWSVTPSCCISWVGLNLQLSCVTDKGNIHRACQAWWEKTYYAYLRWYVIITLLLHRLSELSTDIYDKLFLILLFQGQRTCTACATVAEVRHAPVTCSGMKGGDMRLSLNVVHPGLSVRLCQSTGSLNYPPFTSSDQLPKPWRSGPQSTYSSE